VSSHRERLAAAIDGPRRGQTLELLPSEFTTRAAWVGEHPDTLALDAPAGPSAFDLADFYIVVDIHVEARAYPVPDLHREGVVNDVVAGLENAVVSDPTEPQRWAIYSRQVGDVTVELEIDGTELIDTVTGTRFDPALGLAVGEGELQGTILDRLPGLTSFPGDFDTFCPHGTVWQP
jgi:hypothetical protein